MTPLLKRALVALGTVLVIATAAVAVLSDKSDPSASPSAGSAPAGGGATVDRITIKSFKFMPASATVKAGTKLTFVNDDNAAHTATSNDGSAFDTGGLPQGKSKAVMLTKPGTYTYYCQFHPFMKATVTVR